MFISIDWKTKWKWSVEATEKRQTFKPHNKIKGKQTT